MKQDEKYLKQIWKNIKDGIFYVKGEWDSETNMQVLALKEGNVFCKDNCYWSYVADLPNGTYYATADKCKKMPDGHKVIIYAMSKGE